MRRGKLAILSVGARFDPAQPRETTASLLRWIRLTQDIYRGGGTLLPAMIGTALFNADLVPTLRWVIEDSALDAAALRGLAGDLGVLLMTEPAVGPVISNDSDFMALQTVMPVLKGPDWVPPGGWEEGYGPVSERGTGGLLGGKSVLGVRTEAALLAVAFEEIGREQREACPPDVSIVECRARLIAVAEARAVKAQDMSLWRLSFRILASGDAVREIRRTIIDILAAVALPAFHKYIDRLAERSFVLAAMRLHVLVLAEQQAAGACPSPEGLSGAAWEPALQDPIFGGRLTVGRSDDGRWSVAPAAWFDGAAADDVWAYEFACAPAG